MIYTLEEREALTAAHRRRFEAREERVHPGRDDKGLTSWNGLMLGTFAEAARPLKCDDYRQVAERNAEFLESELRTPKGRLYHTWKGGVAKFGECLYTRLNVQWQRMLFPQLERLEADRRSVGIRAAVDGAIYVADGVQADLNRVLDRELDVPDGEPILAVRAAEGVHPLTDPLQAQENWI
jgi:hypothetical protein